MDDSTVRVLVVEDEPALRVAMERLLRGRGYLVTGCADGTSARDALSSGEFEVALVDFMLPDVNGLDLLREVRLSRNPPEFVMIAGAGTAETAIAAVRLGAYDCITRPYEPDQIEVVVQRAAEKHHLARENAWLQRIVSRQQPAASGPPFVAEGAAMKRVVARVETLARSTDGVLVTGERGTGRKRVAAMLHERSGTGGPLLTIDAEAAGEREVPADLFGAGDGDAPRSAALAARATIVISHIHALPLPIQDELAETLRTGQVGRARGISAPLRARVIALTSRDLRSAVDEGTFHGALHERLAANSVMLPPLRDRPEDIPVLAQRFLAHFGGGGARALAADALETLRGYSWPGNLREMRNVLERVALYGAGDTITADQLPLPRPTTRPSRGEPLSLAELERHHIAAALREWNWHQGNAAAALGISPKTLYRKIREYGFERPRQNPAS